jgi:hypothetical protein
MTIQTHTALSQVKSSANGEIYGLGRFQREEPTTQLCASMALNLNAILISLLKLRNVTEVGGTWRDIRESHLLSSNLLFHLLRSSQSDHPCYDISSLTGGRPKHNNNVAF